MNVRCVANAGASERLQRTDHPLAAAEVRVVVRRSSSRVNGRGRARGSGGRDRDARRTFRWSCGGLRVNFFSPFEAPNGAGRTCSGDPNAYSRRGVVRAAIPFGIPTLYPSAY
jgi:hypothetical protein